MPSIASVFERLDTRNFEVALGAATDEGEARRIRAALVKAVAKVHVYKATYVSAEEYASCAHFLQDFVGMVRDQVRGVVFSTNYDLLLYWTVVHHNPSLQAYDACDNEGVWSAARAWNSQVFQLHGGLHLFGSRDLAGRPVVTKLLWEPRRPLMLQVAEHLGREEFPIFVSEGSSDRKARQIRRSPYLRRAMKAFRQVCADPDGVLFTVGHSLSEEDQHICDAIGAGQVGRVFIGCFGEWDRARAAELAGQWASARRVAGSRPCRVHVFDVRDAAIWTRRDVSLYLPRRHRRQAAP